MKHKVLCCGGSFATEDGGGNEHNDTNQGAEVDKKGCKKTWSPWSVVAFITISSNVVVTVA